MWFVWLDLITGYRWCVYIVAIPFVARGVCWACRLAECFDLGLMVGLRPCLWFC